MRPRTGTAEPFRRRIAWLLTGVGVLAAAWMAAPPAGAGAAGTNVTVRSWMLERTSNAANSYQALASWTEDADHAGWAASVELYGTRATGYAGLHDSSENLLPSGYAAGQSFGCGTDVAGTCMSPLAALGFYEAVGSYPRGHGAPTRVLVVAAGIDPTLTFHGRGWRSAPWSAAVQRRTGADADAAGAQAATSGGVVAGGVASLRGGAGGSVAIAAPPCQDPAPEPVAVGIGTAVLTGGGHAHQLECPSVDTPPILSGVTDHKSRWTLAGPTVGYAAGPTRLIVVDLG